MINESEKHLLKLHLSSFLRDEDEIDMFLHYCEVNSTILTAVTRFIDLPSISHQIIFLDTIKKEIRNSLH